ncbi:MAG: 3-mercaptopyruvate sulfurtransferase [Alphaproteobacteria bacterium MarineAlpha5_Bin11]|nr:3-mercaptopyruvate sulfurtransferase [Pelagibacteraceae bacterium]PPR44172.1 MAG: 3-mercaptopyruvate sulfurtransferase [Alphaproteobacteria bacterium MarineAlpha5_Bin11]|tara:strand:- start:5211 stop:6050 length:840 start_codon:yes stop_codon:yes gene_type:complete
MKVLVETTWLAKNLKRKDIVIIDSSWHMPKENKNSYKEYINDHIPGSVYVDLDNLSDPESILPHMLPSLEKFQTYMRKCGINNNSYVVIYDTKGLWSSPRLWWMFKYFGFKNVYVLNGGLKKWKNEKKVTTKKIIKKKCGNYKSYIVSKYLSNKKNVLKFLKSKDVKIVDARSPERFIGKINEPRKGLRKGHIPNSVNIFWNNLIKKDGTLINDNEIRTILKKYKINKKNQIISTCGSGMTACIITLALAKINFSSISVYDGSWSEWGSDNNLPINELK